MIERCNRCNGTKWVIKLGNLRGKCDLCQGIGHVKTEIEKEKEKPIKEKVKKESKEKRKYNKKVKLEIVPDFQNEIAS